MRVIAIDLVFVCRWFALLRWLSRGSMRPDCGHDRSQANPSGLLGQGTTQDSDRDEPLTEQRPYCPWMLG